MTKIEGHLKICRNSNEYKPTFEGASNIKTKMTYLDKWPGVIECELWRCNLCKEHIPELWPELKKIDERNLELVITEMAEEEKK